MDKKTKSLEELALLQSAPERIRVYLDRARKALESATTEEQSERASSAVAYFTWVLDDLEAIRNAAERNRVGDVVLNLIRAFYWDWKVGINSVAHEIDVGSRVSAGLRKDREFRAKAGSIANAGWQEKADILFAANQNLSLSDAAKKIDPSRWGYIRKRIRKK